MLRQFSSFLGTAALAPAALSLAGSAARTAPAHGYGGIGFGAFGYGGYGYSLPFYGGYGTAPYAAAATPPASYPNPAVASVGPENAPPPDNAAHLQLLVPESAQILFDGEPATQTGKVREFVSPALTPGKVYTYK